MGYVSISSVRLTVGEIHRPPPRGTKQPAVRWTEVMQESRESDSHRARAAHRKGNNDGIDWNDSHQESNAGALDQ